MKQRHPQNGRRTNGSERGKSVTIVGSGGAIGSHLVPHVARMPSVSRVTLIDPDRYESHNLASQEIEARDVGKLKVSVQGRRVRRINPMLTVNTIAERVESIPLGALRCDVILACLDGRKARIAVNEAAWRLGIPWIDAGVGGEQWIARVNGYRPGDGAPCMECAWNDDDYAAVEQTYPCGDGVDPVAPTNSPSHLGGLAAAMQAAECEKIVSARGDTTLAVRQIVLDARSQGQIVSRLVRNPNCRFAHRTWKICPVTIRSLGVTIGDLLQKVGISAAQFDSAALELPGHTFVQTLACVDCQRKSSRRLRIVRRLKGRAAQCPGCGGRMVAGGFDQIERVRVNQVTGSELRRSLRSVGFRDRDVLGVSVGDEMQMVELKIDPNEEGTEQ